MNDQCLELRRVVWARVYLAELSLSRLFHDSTIQHNYDLDRSSRVQVELGPAQCDELRDPSTAVVQDGQHHPVATADPRGIRWHGQHSLHLLFGQVTYERTRFTKAHDLFGKHDFGAGDNTSLLHE